MIPQLGTLVDRPLQQAWAHEALAFTPWLEANLDTLGAALGISIEFEAREVPVEEFRADILARNPVDDSRILIENQLEQADHKHLGQILTYMAGLEVRTVVWIAQGFRQAHLSAIKWLNENTAEGYSFFAVRLRAVQIGDSPLAAVMEVMARPNDWERRLKEVAPRAGELSEVGVFRRGYWEAYLARHPEDRALGLDVVATNNWIAVDASASLIVSMWVARSKLGLFVRGPRGSDGSDLAPRLEPLTVELEARLGARYGRTTGAYFFDSTKAIDLTNRENWPSAIDWQHSKAVTYVEGLRALAVEERSDRG